MLEIDTTLGDYVNGTTDTKPSKALIFCLIHVVILVKQILKSDNCNDTTNT